ncbi:MAG: hypothetical protein R8P61_35640 [Bacteroidia bacterium]|nr:hypothetical protein [Bacteroidia bacterium]
MKREPVLSFLLGMSILLTGFSLHRSQNRIDAMESEIQQIKSLKSENQDKKILRHSMQELQRYSTKLWIAGESNNWNKADLYYTELKALLHDLESFQLTVGDQDLTPRFQRTSSKTLANIEFSIRDKDQEKFRSHYAKLIRSCDTCHDSGKNSFSKWKGNASWKAEESQAISLVLP